MIRSVTVGLPLDKLSTNELNERARRLIAVAGEMFERHKLAPRTLRYTLPPSGIEGEEEGVLLSRLRWVDDLARQTDVRWFCLPLDFVAPGTRRGRLAAALDGIVRFERMFLNLILAEGQRIAVDAVYDAARFVLDVSRKTSNGFDNFRVGTSMNCPPNAPFFPFSRHEGDGIGFSFALETTQLALKAVESVQRRYDAGAARDAIVSAITPKLREVDNLGMQLAEHADAEYRGLDASFAPMPADGVSVAELVETIIGTSIGGSGSVYAAAFLTDALRTAVRESGARTAGFNGVMYSVLEDPVLAASNSRRGVTIDSLLASAAVCACGLDMVPVPGLSFAEEIGAVMLDVAGLSCALNKPLGVRLLPIPSGHAGDLTRLNLDFLCDSRVVGLSSNDQRLVSEEHLLNLRTPRH